MQCDDHKKHHRFPGTIDELEKLTQEYYPDLDPWNRPWVFTETDGKLEIRSLGADEHDASDDIVRVVEP